MNDPKIKYYLLAALGIVGVSTAALLVIYGKSKKQTPASQTLPPPPPVQKEEKTAPPTLSPQQIEIIKKIETHTVEIINGQFNPATLTIKPHDQVMWKNKDGKTHNIKGEGWGNVPIENGENYTHSFEQPGTYPYSCALHPEMKGTIIVK